MSKKSIKNKELKNNTIKFINHIQNCKVSNASNDLMLDRIYNGQTIEFPFS